MPEKKLEDAFASVNYSSPVDNTIEITIVDDKVRNLALESLHIVSSKSLLYIYLNDSYPIFKHQLDKKLQIKEYHYISNSNCLSITIMGYQIEESIQAFTMRKAFQSFFKYALGRLYAQYKNQNSILVHYVSLKKKAVAALKEHYFARLKRKIVVMRLSNYSKVLYSKAYLFKCQMRLFERIHLSQKLTLFIYRTFFGKVAMKQVANEEKEANTHKAIEHSLSNLKIKALKGFAYRKQLLISLGALSSQFHSKQLKQRAFSVLLADHSSIRKQKDRLRKYNRMNYSFLELLSSKYIKESYSLRIKTSREILLAFIALLKNNRLKGLYTGTKLARLAIVKTQKEKIARLRLIIISKQFIKKQKAKEMRSVYNALANRLLNAKISRNKAMIVNCLHRQKTLQGFLTNLAEMLSDKYKFRQLNLTWRQKVMKYRLYEFLSALFLSKTLNEAKVICQKVTSSFEIVSLRLLTKKRQKTVQTMLEQNSFDKFKRGVRTLKFNRLVNYKKHYLIKKHKRLVYSQFIKLEKKKALIHQRAKHFQLNSIRRVFRLYQQRIQSLNWTQAAVLSRHERLKHNSLIVLHHYAKFKKEKAFRDNYFNNRLTLLIKAHRFSKYFIKGTVLLKCMKVTRISQEDNRKRSVLILMRKQLARSSVNEIISYSLQIKFIQLMLQAAYAKNNLLEKEHLLERKANQNHICRFIRTIEMRKKIKKQFTSKIKLLNVKKAFRIISSVIKFKDIENYLHIKYQFKHLMNSLKRKRKTKQRLLSKQVHLLIKLPFIYFKSINRSKQKQKGISWLYFGFIIRERVLKPIKISRLLQSLSSLVRYNNFLLKCYLLKQMRMISLTKKVALKRREKAIKLFLDNQLFNRQFNKTINQLIRLFNIKHSLKHFMIVVLDRIRNELFESKKRGLLLKRSYSKLKQKDKTKRQKELRLNQRIQKAQHDIRLNHIFALFYSMNRHIQVSNIKAKSASLLLHKMMKEYFSFFNIIAVHFHSKKKRSLIHQRHMKEVKERLIDGIKAKMLLLKKSTFMSIRDSYRHFINNSNIIINIKALAFRKKKLICIKAINRLHHLVQQKKASKKTLSSGIKYKALTRKRKLKNVYANFVKEVFYLKKANRRLKRKLFDLLKEHCSISHDINFYLNQAKGLVTEQIV